jgi:hypothetical protein
MNQVQLDIYGEVIRGAAVHYHNSRPHRPSPDARDLLRKRDKRKPLVLFPGGQAASGSA